MRAWADDLEQPGLTDFGRRFMRSLARTRSPTTATVRASAWATYPRGLAQIAAFTDEHPSRVLHIRYPALVNDSADAVGQVCASFSIPDGELAGRVGAFLERQRRGARAAPPAELPSMGYAPADIWSDPATSACERFGIEPERIRLTGQRADEAR